LVTWKACLHSGTLYRSHYYLKTFTFLCTSLYSSISQMPVSNQDITFYCLLSTAHSTHHPYVCTTTTFAPTQSTSSTTPPSALNSLIIRSLLPLLQYSVPKATRYSSVALHLNFDSVNGVGLLHKGQDQLGPKTDKHSCKNCASSLEQRMEHIQHRRRANK
jgi:hypothetical protein